MAKARRKLFGTKKKTQEFASQISAADPFSISATFKESKAPRDLHNSVSTLNNAEGGSLHPPSPAKRRPYLQVRREKSAERINLTLHYAASLGRNGCLYVLGERRGFGDSSLAILPIFSGLPRCIKVVSHGFGGKLTRAAAVAR